MFSMDSLICKQLLSIQMNSAVSKCFILVVFILVVRIVVLFPDLYWFQESRRYLIPPPTGSSSQPLIRKVKFLEVPQIVWGLNNQKIAFARACLTARLLNRTLLMPRLSASLFYKEVDLLEPIWFENVFQYEKFNSICNGFIRIGRYSDLLNQSKPFQLQKGSGRKWTKERDLDQLKQCRETSTDDHEVIQIVGKNPFLWHDHWPIKDYAKIFECLVLVDNIGKEAAKVISKIREAGSGLRGRSHVTENMFNPTPYIAVHMRVEKDWVIHCKKLEQRSNITQICSSKEEIMRRVGRISNLEYPVVVYLAVADTLLEDGLILSGWKEGLLPFEKKKLGVWDIYKKYPYLIQSAIDYEVCLRSDVFVGNSFSTFSSLVVLERTQKLIRRGVRQSCGVEVQLASYAYNIEGEHGGPQRWMTDMSLPSLDSISYGTNNISCHMNSSL